MLRDIVLCVLDVVLGMPRDVLGMPWQHPQDAQWRYLRVFM